MKSQLGKLRFNRPMVWVLTLIAGLALLAPLEPADAYYYYRGRHHHHRHSYGRPASNNGPEQPDMPEAAEPPTSSSAAPAPSDTAPRFVSGVPAPNEQRYAVDEVLFTLVSDAQAGTINDIAGRLHLTLFDAFPIRLIGRPVYRCRILDGRPVADVIRDLEGDSRVAAAQPNYKYQLAATSSAHQGVSQYALDRIRLPEALRISQGQGAVVAIIDNGVDKTQPELLGSIADSFDAVGDGGGPESHGTAIAAILVAHSELQGVAPRAKILAVRAFGGTGESAGGTTAQIIVGFGWAYEHSARVINMGFTGPRDPLLGEAIAAARARGAILVAAAGNVAAPTLPLYPGADPNVIAVTSTDDQDKLYMSATRGPYVDIAAPGVEVVVAAPKGTYQFSTGTSMAAAYVSGVVALLVSAKPDIDPDTVRNILHRTSHTLGAPGGDEDYGAGLIDATAALQDLRSPNAGRGGPGHRSSPPSNASQTQ